MKKISFRSKTSLFLIEMLLSLLILSLAMAACIRVFAAASRYQKRAGIDNHIQELTLNVGEILEGSDGSMEDFLSFLGSGAKKSDHELSFFYDKDWKPVDDGNSAEYLYEMDLDLQSSSDRKTVRLSFTDKEENVLFTQEISFPADQAADNEGDHE